MATVTIQHLEVRFEVEGDGEDAVFARLFEKHIRRWSRAEAEARARQRLGAQQRQLGDAAAGEAR